MKHYRRNLYLKLYYVLILHLYIVVAMYITIHYLLLSRFFNSFLSRNYLNFFSSSLLSCTYVPVILALANSQVKFTREVVTLMLNLIAEVFRL